MDMFPIAPDGALIDRVAEFALLNKNSAERLYSADPDGYRDALGKFLQVLACGGNLLGDLNRSTSEASAELKNQLHNFQKMEHLSFPPRISVENEVVDDWFAENWGSFCAELQDPGSAALYVHDWACKKRAYFAKNKPGEVATRPRKEMATRLEKEKGTIWFVVAGRNQERP